VRANAPIARTPAGTPDLARTRTTLPALAAAGVTLAAFPLPAIAPTPTDLHLGTFLRLAQMGTDLGA
jgi:hypothetical protein